MPDETPSVPVGKSEIEGALNEPQFGAIVGRGAPAFLATGEPVRVIWANAQAQALFSAAGLEDLTARCLAGQEPGARQLARLARRLDPGAPARLQRLLFDIGGASEMLTFLCRRFDGRHALFGVAALDVRPALLESLTQASASNSASRDAAAIAQQARPPLLEQPHAPASAGADQQMEIAQTFAAAVTGNTPEKAQEVASARAGVAALDFAGLPIRKDRGGNVRFLWRTGRDGRLIDLAGALCETVGCDTQALIGESFAVVIERFGIDPQGRLRTALARRETWSGIEVNWPVAGTSEHLPIVFGALPAFDRARNFDGFSGFGVIHVDRRFAAPVPEVSGQDIFGEKIGAQAVAKDSQTASQEPASQEPASQESASGTAKIDTSASNTINAARPVLPPPAGSVLPPVERITAAQGDASAVKSSEETTSDVQSPEAELPQAPTTSEDLVQASGKQGTATSDDSAKPGPTTGPENAAKSEKPEGTKPSLLAGRLAPNVVALRRWQQRDGDKLLSKDITQETTPETAGAGPGQSGVRNTPEPSEDVDVGKGGSAREAINGASKDAAPVTPPATVDSAQHDAQAGAGSGRNVRHDGSVELSPSERNAFREIARALGAKFDHKDEVPGKRREIAKIADDKPADEKPADDKPARERTAHEKSAHEKNTDEIAASGKAPNQTSTDGVSAADDEAGEQFNTGDIMPVLQAPVALTPAPLSTLAPAAIAAGLSAGVSGPDIATSADHQSAALLDRLDAGVLVTCGGVPAYANRTFLEWLGHKDIDAFHTSGGIDHMFKGRSPEALTSEADGGAIPVMTATGDVLALEGRMQTIEWAQAPAMMLTLRQSRSPELIAKLRALELQSRKREVEAQELHAILDTATDGVAILDEEGRLLSLNKSAQALFGIEQNEIAGERFTVLLARESHSSAFDYLEGLKKDGVKIILNDGREVMGQARRGGPIPLFMTIGRIGAHDGLRFCAVMRDLTQWKKVERELHDARREAERTSALKSDFLAKISHEIRTPLNAILGFAEVIIDERFGPVGNERYKDYLKDIHTSGNHVLSLVNDLLDLSKIEAGKLDLNFVSVDSNRIVNECVSIMQAQAIRERVIMRLSLAPRLPNIVADERSLRQIVLNILSNAIKFNQPGGQVIVSTALTDAGHAVIRVRDTGIGMNDKEMEQAIEPFRRVATARPTSGTGLGLPLTKALTEANRAAFSIKSRKGEGTMVEVAFPPTRVLAE